MEEDAKNEVASERPVHVLSFGIRIRRGQILRPLKIGPHGKIIADSFSSV